jgi:hypothetical protein
MGHSIRTFTFKGVTENPSTEPVFQGHPEIAILLNAYAMNLISSGNTASQDNHNKNSMKVPGTL